MYNTHPNVGGGTCFQCGQMLISGISHRCPPGTYTTVSNSPASAPFWTLQRCPVCEGRGHVQADFYGQIGSATNLSPEQCRSCDGRGMLRVSAMGSVEKLT